MNKLKKALLIMAILTTGLMADYTVIKNTTVPDLKGEGKEIFFGTVADYSKMVTEVNKAVVEHGVDGALNGLSSGADSFAKGIAKEGLKSLGAGLVMGAAVGLLDPYVMNYRYDQEYVLVSSYDNGELEALMFIGDKHPSLSEKEIHKILKNK